MNVTVTGLPDVTVGTVIVHSVPAVAPAGHAVAFTVPPDTDVNVVFAGTTSSNV